jgi:ATP-dependent Clp protease ATP-binding subunit ClpA
MSSEDIGFQTKPATGIDGVLANLQKMGSSSVASKAKTAIERTFSPEFRNRLDAWIVFNPLTIDDIKRVVDKFVKELVLQLQEKQVVLELSEEARTWLAVKGFDKAFGARPMHRLIQQKLKEPLAEEILFGKLENGGRAVAHVENDNIVLQCFDTVVP